jgi:hypothetical protein
LELQGWKPAQEKFTNPISTNNLGVGGINRSIRVWAKMPDLSKKKKKKAEAEKAGWGWLK